MKEEIARWRRLSEDDFNSAKINFDNKLYYVCAFLCQQSVEKALKCVLLKKSKRIIKIHDLIILGKKVNLPSDILQKCEALNAVYLETRYVDFEDQIPSKKFDKTAASEFLDTAKEVLKWLEKNI
jgi:HEPN domain-containing protein